MFVGQTIVFCRLPASQATEKRWPAPRLAWRDKVCLLNSRTTYQFNRQFSARAITRFDSSRKRVLADFLAAYEFVPGTVAYAGYGALYERRGWDGTEWQPGQGNYPNSRRGFFFKLSYLYRL